MKEFALWKYLLANPPATVAARHGHFAWVGGCKLLGTFDCICNFEFHFHLLFSPCLFAFWLERSTEAMCGLFVVLSACLISPRYLSMRYHFSFLFSSWSFWVSFTLIKLSSFHLLVVEYLYPVLGTFSFSGPHLISIWIQTDFVFKIILSHRLCLAPVFFIAT